MKSKGLGDTVEKITKATGIKKATKWIFDKLGKDCGCEARKEKLNKMFPYKNPECLTEDEYIYLKGFFLNYTDKIESTEQIEILKIYNRVFKQKRGTSTCSTCVRGLVETMKRLFNEYEYEREIKSN
jgi:hypothetical protein